ncbi:MAG: biotin transporter BioY [Acidobacteriota bacterium]|nr:biotin transporter BioY [Acidobacteriota bacterium]
MVRPTFFSAVTDRIDSAASQRGVRAAAVLLMAALTAAAAQVSVPLPFTPVPLTFQPMIVLLGGVALGSTLGMWSQVAYLALGLLGLPVFAASPLLPQGLARLAGPTGGYLLCYPVAAFVAGWLAERGLDRRYLGSVAAMAAGLVVIYASGTAWLALMTPSAAGGFQAALAAGVYPFVLADIFKLFLAAGVMPGLWKLTGLRGSQQE